MDCHICNKTHLIEKRQRESTCLVKDDNEFVSDGIIVQNLLSSKDAYRINNGLLNSN